jgi:hypothetical protein
MFWFYLGSFFANIVVGGASIPQILIIVVIVVVRVRVRVRVRVGVAVILGVIYQYVPMQEHLQETMMDQFYRIHSNSFSLVLVLNCPSLSGSCTPPLNNLSDFPLLDWVVMIYGKVFEKYFHFAVLRLLLGVYL